MTTGGGWGGAWGCGTWEGSQWHKTDRMFKWFQGAAGKPNADKKVSTLDRPTPDIFSIPILSLQVEYQELKNDQLYNPYSEVLVLTGHISTVHQIEVIYENRQVH